MCRLLGRTILSVLMTPTLVGGTVSIWSGGAGDWTDPANWTDNAVPAAGNTILIDDGNASASECFINVNNLIIGGATIDADDTLRIGNARIFRASGTVMNNGLIQLDSTGNATYLRPDGATLTLTGGGIVELSDSADNWIYRQSIGGELVNMDNTIRGAGNLSWSSAPTPITNGAAGTIVANGTNPLICDAGSVVFTNRGTLRADGGTLVLESTFDNDNGLIEALDSSTVALNGALIQGGTLDSSGSGEIRANGVTSVLDGSVNDVVNAGMLRVDNARILVGTGTIHNTGTIRVDSTANATYFRPNDGPLRLTGGGTIEMSDSENNWIYRHAIGGELINVDNTIQGAGNVSWSSAPTPITNEAAGLIVANATNPLVCDSGTTVFTNRGTLRADGGTLVVEGTLDNVDGLIEARDGSTVALNGVTIQGGTLDSSGTGEVAANGSPSLLDGSVDEVVNAGMLRVSNARILVGTGTLRNTGTIRVDSTGGSTYLRPNDGPLRLTGGGTVEMSDSANNWIYRNASGGELINVDNTIQGAGNISWSSAPTPITNEAAGLIVANVTTPLVCDSGSVTFTNRGTMRADGGTLVLEGTLDNVDGLVEASDGSTVALNGVAIQGGTLGSSGSGEVAVSNANALLDGTANDVNNTGMLRVGNARILVGIGTIHNTGTIRVDSTGGNTYLRPGDGLLRLTGGGTIEFSDSPANWIYRNAVGGEFTNVDNTIRGAGRFGWSSAPTPITNEPAGVIVADATNALICDGGAELFDNRGLMRASGAAGLAIRGNYTTSGTVVVDAGSQLVRTHTTPYTQTAGTTEVNGSMSANNGVAIAGGVLKGIGEVTANVQNDDRTEPGSSPGTLTITGNYTQGASGTLSIELGGFMADSEHDLLDVSATATLDGTLEAVAINEFAPSIGDRFTILTVGAHSGRFAQFAAIGFADATLTVRADYGNETQVDLVVVRVGDMNCDGNISVGDINPFVAALTAPADYMTQFPDCELLNGDINGDGTVSVSDINGFVALLTGG